MTIQVNQVFHDLIAYDPDLFRANHLLKVTGYAEMIGGAEGMAGDDLLWLRIAATLHDIGIKPSLEKFGSAIGPNQQAEGPPLARALLEKYSPPPERVDRVCYLIAHHHEYSNIDGLDYQILVEADFLVNCDEGEMAKREIRSVRDTIFKTETGIGLVNRLYGFPSSLRTIPS